MFINIKLLHAIALRNGETKEEPVHAQNSSEAKSVIDYGDLIPK